MGKNAARPYIFRSDIRFENGAPEAISVLYKSIAQTDVLYLSSTIGSIEFADHYDVAHVAELLGSDSSCMPNVWAKLKRKRIISQQALDRELAPQLLHLTPNISPNIDGRALSPFERAALLLVARCARAKAEAAAGKKLMLTDIESAGRIVREIVRLRTFPEIQRLRIFPKHDYERSAAIIGRAAIEFSDKRTAQRTSFDVLTMMNFLSNFFLTYFASPCDALVTDIISVLNRDFLRANDIVTEGQVKTHRNRHAKER